MPRLFIFSFLFLALFSGKKASAANIIVDNNSISIPDLIFSTLPQSAFFKHNANATLFPGEKDQARILYALVLDRGFNFFSKGKAEIQDLETEEDALINLKKASKCFEFATKLKKKENTLALLYLAESLKELAIFNQDSTLADKALGFYSTVTTSFSNNKINLNDYQQRYLYVLALTSSCQLKIDFEKEVEELVKVQLQEAEALGEEIGFEEATKILQQNY